ncbi:rRNA maturation RNase YbeY [uncultured Lactobacillus sp.]|uniref:rRNA maturation RNase YbeY n=1 Tax=uncultured Lactobacillus sp. TaxID=153152 RepID=UPI00272CB624|nr:rRNA maturation RNase YbeY [uncultured Lactobacillus sp.]
MTSYVENETAVTFPFDCKELLDRIMEQVMEMEACPYETSVNLLITDNEGIREYNKNYRNIDKETDVLSFPNLYFETAGDFTFAEDNEPDCFDPDSGELLLGDIILSADRIREQAEEYGHSLLREFAFLTAHSLFHLCGYDHMEPEDAAVMEQKQEDVLIKLQITRG